MGMRSGRRRRRIVGANVVANKIGLMMLRLLLLLLLVRVGVLVVSVAVDMTVLLHCRWLRLLLRRWQLLRLWLWFRSSLHDSFCWLLPFWLSRMDHCTHALLLIVVITILLLLLMVLLL